MYKNLISAILLAASMMASIEAMNLQQQMKTPRARLAELIKSYPEDTQAAKKELIALQAAIADPQQDLSGMLRFSIHAGIDDINVYKALLQAGASPLQTQYGQTPRAFLEERMATLKAEISNIIEKKLPELRAKSTYIGNKYAGVSSYVGGYGAPESQEVTDLKGELRAKQARLENLRGIAKLLATAEKEQTQQNPAGTSGKTSDSPVLRSAGMGEKLGDSPVRIGASLTSDGSPVAPGGPKT